MHTSSTIIPSVQNFLSNKKVRTELSPGGLFNHSTALTRQEIPSGAPSWCGIRHGQPM
ncbi:hypothetical protein DFP97_101176 [Paenibacillus prosopidis]|uniref:Uncharacterized protein n=1 Tax=Paenibacillus prosopidis TaxID=630520 RepID=A0A368W901_9BACL|nr:hypothetical protein DFP97_101176 [Paenibacillus prosopidis]